MSDLSVDDAVPSGPSFWDREFLGIPMKWAIPIGGAALLGAVVFFLWYRRKSGANAASQSGQPNTNATLSVPGSQLAAAGLVPYYGTGGPTGSGFPVSGGTWTTRGDTSYGSGTIPIVLTPNPSGPQDTIANIPETTALQSLGISVTSPTPVSGSWPGEGQRNYYPVSLPGGTTGYVLTQDLQLAPMPAQQSSFYSGPTSLASGLVPPTYLQQGYSTGSYPFVTGFQ